ncbi:MAG: response regulator [Lachnospiraceae bacterium]|nr:response regulator [Lachnospiraceae bacterium]
MNRVLFTGEKESFLVRVLIKKLNDAGLVCEFVHWGVNEINSKWNDTKLVVMYMDEGETPQDVALHFLCEKMIEDGVQMIPIGDKNAIRFIKDRVSGDLVYAVYERPIDNAAFVDNVSEMFRKLESGEFRKTILIVDDDPSYLGLVREWLKGTYKVAMANSGLQAIKWLGKNKADLILLDHEMPVTTGPQVLEMLRSEEETKNIPVIFLTGKGDKESVMAVVALKPEGYFLKTIEREELLAKLKIFFENRK